MSRNQRIKALLKEKKISQLKLAEHIGITDSAVNQQLNSDKEVDSFAFMSAVSTLTGMPIMDIIHGEGYEADTETKEMPEWISTNPRYSHPIQGPYHTISNAVSEASLKYLAGKEIRPVAVVVNQHGKELITLVGVKAQAGYMRGYADVKYVEKLPAFALPIVKEGTHRMFEVDGESMRQLGGAGLNDGDIVIAKYVEDIFSIKDNRVYVIICTDGVLVKRCVNRLKDHDNPMIVAKSDNKTKSDNSHEQYPNIIIRPEEIREIWELTAYISTSLSFSVDLWDTISDLQVHQARMEEKIRAMEQKQLK